MGVGGGGVFQMEGFIFKWGGVHLVGGISFDGGVEKNCRRLGVHPHYGKPWACMQFCRKRAKYLKIWAKMYKIWKYFEKGSLIYATITCMNQLEYAPVDIKSAILYFVCQEYGQLICRHFHFCVNPKFILREIFTFFWNNSSHVIYICNGSSIIWFNLDVYSFSNIFGKP